ncbi:hypothetical protein ROE7235_03324 [Roseibaca ekhonensis]|uniref:Uncharacterized protein n=1 Tax=Roseinatronobacter ekhonensis TaxID=254356 RepID=A0A3B0MCK3_9RHOB|nr:hypothetical protein ROE7235_03324 [Roseibaca ekhonensis]
MGYVCTAGLGRSSCSPPLRWFLPGLIRIRGGLARNFSSDWLFHRGIHLEATPADCLEFLTQHQRVARKRPWPGWIPFGIQGSHFTDSSLARSHQRKPPRCWPFPDLAEHIDSTSENSLTKLPPLTYPFIIEELHPEETPLGCFRFPHIADADPAAGPSGRMAWSVRPAPNQRTAPWT